MTTSTHEVFHPMIIRVLILLALAGLCLNSSGLAQKKNKLPTVRIATIAEGNFARGGDLRSTFEREILALTSTEFIVRFPDNLQVTGDYTSGGVRENIRRLLDDPDVDLIISLGPLATTELCLWGELSKPVVAPFAVYPRIQKLPRADGKSGEKNLSYITFPSDAPRDIEVFRTLASFDSLIILFNRSFHDGTPGLIDNILRQVRSSGIGATALMVDSSADQVLTAIPPDAQAVYITPLLMLGDTAFARLISGLNSRKLPTFSMFGRSEVEAGVFASLAPSFDYVRLARRVALYVQRILHGEDPADLPVSLERQEQLTINMATARTINVYPSWDILTEAEVINEEQIDAGRSLNLAQAIREAVLLNLTLAASRKDVAAGRENIARSRSRLLPQLSIGAQGVLIDKDRAEASLGSQAERTLSGSATLSQIIFSEPAWADLSIQGDLQRGREQELEQLRLDISLDAATAYLNVLRAKTLQRVQKENLKTTKANLELAETRVSVGAAGRQEVFRWQSEIASRRIDVIAADAQRRQAEAFLNRILHQPLESLFLTTETGLGDTALLVSDKRLFRFTDNPWLFRVFRDFMVQEGLNRSPELKQLDATIAAQDRQYGSAKNAFWAPTLAVRGELTNIFSRSGAGTPSSLPALPFTLPQADDLNWTIGLNLSLPIFSGGERFATLSQSREHLMLSGSENRRLPRKLRMPFGLRSMRQECLSPAFASHARPRNRPGRTSSW
jgi:outer membrane protein